jgi:hypothetical protein
LEIFGFKAGVKQGDGLSAVLFIVALHNVLKTIDQRATIFTKSSQICAYADDIVIIARTRQKIIEIYKKMEDKARKIGLKINESKTKYRIMSTSENRRKTQDLKVEGKSFMGVNNFKYLGNMLSNDNRNDNCVKEMIQAGNTAYFANPRLLKILRIFERKIIRKIYGPVMKNNSWRIQYNEISKLLKRGHSKIHKVTENQMAGTC